MKEFFHYIYTFKKQSTKEALVMAKFTTVFLLVASLSGCAFLDPTDAYTPTPQHIVNKDVFGSQVTTETLAGPMTLAIAIDIALVNNPGIAVSRYDVEAVKSQHDIAVGALWPTINLVGSYSHFRDERLITPRRPGTAEVLDFTDDLFIGNAVLRIPLFSGGKLVNEIRASNLLQAVSEHRLARNREELVFNVSSVFFNILSQRHVIESLEFSQRTLKEHLKRVGELIQAQKAAKVDQIRTEVRLADLEQRLAQERNIHAIQGRVLTNLLGLEKFGSDPVSVSGMLTIDEIIFFDLDASLAKALTQRSDYLAARTLLESQAKQVDIARAGHSPTLALEGSYGVLSSVDSGDMNNEVGSVGLGLDIPLFAGGRISAKVRQEQAKLAAGQEKLRHLDHQIRLDVETAMLNMASSHERVKATKKSIEQAEESLRIEREKYGFAKGSITDVLDAQSALLGSQMNYYRALADYNTALAQFRLAIGEEK